MDNDKFECAGFWTRLASFCIDGSIINTTCVLLVVLTGFLIGHTISSFLFTKLIVSLWIFAFWGLAIAYFGWLNAEGRQSIGKRLFGIGVCDYDFQPISPATSFKRAVFYVISATFFWIGHFLILFARNKRAFHDLMAKTVVVQIKPRPVRHELMILIVIIAGFFMSWMSSYLLKETTIKTYRIPTGSKKPTIFIGDYIVVDKSWKGQENINPGDLVVFKFPKNESVEYVSRCIAIGGQTVELKSGRLYIDGQPEGHLEFISSEFDPEESRSIDTYQVSKPDGQRYFICLATKDSYRSKDFGPFEVPKNHFFTLGDNRDNSYDSRFWGAVPNKNITGRPGFVYFSWDKFKKGIRWKRIGKNLY